MACERIQWTNQFWSLQTNPISTDQWRTQGEERAAFYRCYFIFIFSHLKVDFLNNFDFEISAVRSVNQRDPTFYPTPPPTPFLRPPQQSIHLGHNTLVGRERRLNLRPCAPLVTAQDAVRKILLCSDGPCASISPYTFTDEQYSGTKSSLHKWGHEPDVINRWRRTLPLRYGTHLMHEWLSITSVFVGIVASYANDGKGTGEHAVVKSIDDFFKILDWMDMDEQVKWTWKRSNRLSQLIH